MNFTLRDATEDDAASLAQMHIAGWRAAYDGLVDQAVLDTLDATERARDWTGWMADGLTPLIASLDGRDAGFISFGKLKTPPPGLSPIRPLYSAEVYALYLLPDFWRQGLGRQLLSAAAIRLKDQRHKSLCLWVMEKNRRANDFYKALGGQRCGKKQADVGCKMLTEVCYGWRDSSNLILSSRTQ